LDGLDEVDYDFRPQLEKQIIELQENNRNLTIVISSRPDGRFTSWAQFPLYAVEALSEKDLIKLISKIPYDKDVKKEFSEQIKSGLFTRHSSFLSKPLLATMMLLTFDQFAQIPDKIHIFYEQAFETLFFRHDMSKQAAFQRKRHTSLAIIEFRNTLSSFCIINFR
jgi:hypothetical protein